MRFVLAMLLLGAWAGPLSAARSSVELKSGARVQGDVVLERPGEIYLDLGFDVLAIPKSKVAAIREAGASGRAAEAAPDDTGRLYATASDNREERPIREWVRELGEAVTLVQTPTGLGSGFVVHPDGYVVTNDHVIAGEHKISVTVFENDGKSLEKATFEDVRIVATSSEMDLALLKIRPERETRFQTVVLGRSDELRQGQTVFAIGSPMGLDRTVSEGIVSATNRAIQGRLYLQTTSQINPGNSGGPLFNLEGEVVGVTNMKIMAMGAEGLGFAIPARALKMFLNNRDAFAFDPRNPNAGFRYVEPPRPGPPQPDRDGKRAPDS